MATSRSRRSKRRPKEKPQELGISVRIIRQFDPEMLERADEYWLRVFPLKKKEWVN